jgi:hypothetical protein
MTTPVFSYTYDDDCLILVLKCVATATRVSLTILCQTDYIDVKEITAQLEEVSAGKLMIIETCFNNVMFSVDLNNGFRRSIRMDIRSDNTSEEQTLIFDYESNKDTVLEMFRSLVAGQSTEDSEEDSEKDSEDDTEDN